MMPCLETLILLWKELFTNTHLALKQQVGGKKGTKAKSAKQRRQEDQIAADEPELHSEEDVDPAVDDMRYKKLVLKLRGFLNEKSKDVKDPNITKSVLKRLKVRFATWLGRILMPKDTC